MIDLNEILKKKDEHIFCIDSDIKYTYKDLKSCLSNLYYFYEYKYDLSSLDKVVYVAKNSYDLLVNLIFFNNLNISTIGINYSIDDSNIINIIDDMKPNLIIYSSSYRRLISQISYKSEQIELVHYECNNLNLEKLISYKVNKQKTTYLLSSGTSGVPKIIKKTNSSLLQRMNNMDYVLKCVETIQYNFLVTMPLYHASILGWIRYILRYNGTIVIPEIFDEGYLDKIVLKENINCMLITPNKLSRMSVKKRMEFVIIGGSYLSMNCKVHANNIFGANIYEYYGTSETGINSIKNINTSNNTFKSLPGVKYKVLSKEQDILDNGVGQLMIKSYEMFDEYINHSNNNKLKLEEDYFITNDIVNLLNNEIVILYRKDHINKIVNINYNEIQSLILTVEGINDIKIREENRLLTIYIDSTNVNKEILMILITKLITDDFNVKYIESIEYSLTGKSQ